MNVVALFFEINLLTNYGPLHIKRWAYVKAEYWVHPQLIILVSIRMEIKPKKTNMTAQYIFSLNMQLATI
jgi:hypothetical protein